MKKIFTIEIFKKSLDPLNPLLTIRLIILKFWKIDWIYDREKQEFIK